MTRLTDSWQCNSTALQVQKILLSQILPMLSGMGVFLLGALVKWHT